MRQLISHSDCVLLQDTHIDESLEKVIQKEFPGQWAFSNKTTASAGVAIAVFGFGKNMSSDFEHISDDGRLLGKLLTINKEKFYLISCYAPCCDTSQATRLANLQLLRKAQNLMICQRALGHTVVLGGDLNFIRDEDLDAKGGNPRIHEPQANWLNYLESNVGFQDIARFMHPNNQIFTWAPTGKNVRGIFRRLDYMLADTPTLEKVTHNEVIATASSDHRITVTHFKLGNERITGRGMWRHNDNHLGEDEYCKLIEDTILTEKKEQLSNARFRWEWIKHKIRDVSMRFGGTRAKEMREERLKLEAKYAEMIKDGNNGGEALEAKIQLERFFQEKDESIRFRSNVDEVEGGEKISAFFFRKIQQNREESNIESIRTEEFPDGTKNRADTMKAIHTHFKRTFQDKEKICNVDDTWWETVPTISDELKETLDRPVTLNDLTVALFKNMSPSKAPGNDGLSVKFLRKFWIHLGPLLMESLKESWEFGELSTSQKQSVIRLIQKKDKDHSMISGHRPISLMNNDAKIYAKALSERLRKLTNEVVDSDQLAYMESRSVHEGHVLINRVLELARAKKVKGLMATIDFRGAFDSIRHDFIWKTLEKMNVGPGLINHLKVLYRDARSSVLNYGTTTDWFPLERSTRQGDPVASQLFIIVMQVLLKRLQASLTPIEYKKFILNLIAYADDLTIFVNSDEQLRKALDIIASFKDISGLTVNIQKSEILEIGIKTSITEIKRCDQVKITGVLFTLDRERMVANNWDYVEKRVKDKIKGWQGRNLTEMGKSILVKTVIMPIISYTGSIVELPDKSEKKLTAAIFNFIWGNTDKITRALAHQPRERGGLGIPLIRAKLEAFKATWIAKLPNEEKPWTRAFDIGTDWSKDGILNSLIRIPSENSYSAQCIRAWNGIIALLAPEEDDTRIAPYLSTELKKVVQKKVPNLLFRQVKERLLDDTNLNYLEKGMLYSGLAKASCAREDSLKKEAQAVRERLFHKVSSRQKWPKQLIPGSPVQVRDDENRLEYNGKHPSTFVKQRQVYELYMSQLVPPLNPFRSRMEANLGIAVDWKALDRTKLFISTKYESFCWRSLHGLIYTNRDYKRFGVKQDEKCQCGEVQNLTHLMVDYQKSKNLYANFQVQFGLKEKLTDCEKMMGIDPTKTRTKAVLKKLAILRNAIIMSNYRDEVLRWETVLEKIDRCYVSEYAVANRQDKLPKHFKSWDK